MKSVYRKLANTKQNIYLNVEMLKKNFLHFHQKTDVRDKKNKQRKNKNTKNYRIIQSIRRCTAITAINVTDEGISILKIFH